MKNDINKLKMVSDGELLNYTKYNISEIKICSPIKKPIHDIICVGVNYKDHLEETKQSFGESGFEEPIKSV